MLTLNHSPVQSDPNILGGTLVFRKTRVMAQTLLEYIDSGQTLETFLEHFPSVDKSDAVEFLNMVREESTT